MLRLTTSRAAAVVAAAALVLTGCAPTLPTEGEVESVGVPLDADYEEYGPNPAGPTSGAMPEDIIDGFLDAGAGPQNDYEIAREYLTDEAAEEWNPGERTLVYEGDNRETSPSGESIYNVQLVVDAHIDSDGIMTRPQDVQGMTFELEQVDGEWRISTPPDGTILEANMFYSVYQPYTLFFFDPQESYVVPDVRWFVNRAGLPAEIANQLLRGPAPWLSEGVVSAFDEEASLASPSVPIDAGAARVDLAPSAVSGASDRELALMHYQMQMTLDQLSTVQRVEFTSGGNELDVPEPGDLPEGERLDINARPSADESMIGVRDDALVLQTGGTTSALSGMPDLTDIGPRFPAMPTASTGEVVAFMSEDLDELYHVRPDTEEPTLLVESENMTRPSMDNFGWTWTVTHEGDNPTIRAYSYDDPEDTTSTQFEAAFLEDREVTSLRISQDGARAAIVVEDAGVTSLYIASVIRDGTTGLPRGLGQHTRLEADDQVGLQEVRWADATEVVVWEPYDPDEDDVAPEYIQRIDLSGARSDPEEGFANLLNVAVGEGSSLSVYAEQQGVGVYMLIGEEWSIQEEMDGVEDLSYSG
ncbi:hypothetical protein HGQ17_12760 [Nesterenkonia sp. MY13]|uniref:GerMN domain-containing protein n=1 Tax=Nesterenkonia sedimenti TaxID=1463632 RepID=A0A7X8TLZ8_9MICC|nr:LpqB family beta-propeller domain-containing protein [Nesterenkonia sedimenti]NLS10847.1 hypothetical protein [Nesterenkonia sedimenti]